MTAIHARVGERAFGTTPGEAVVMATLRAHEEEVAARLAEKLERLAEGVARAHGLGVEVEWTEQFPATANDARIAEIVAAAARGAGAELIELERPFPWSEDFGHFTGRYPGVLYGLGSGVETPALHAPTYDFPDELLEPGVEILHAAVRRLLERG